MKKKSLLIISILMLLSFCLLNYSKGDVSKAERIINESSIYSEDEINQAMDKAIKRFKEGYTDCILIDIQYDDQWQDDSWAEQYNANEAIVLKSSFYTGDKSIEAGFNPNDKYSNWMWILVRNNQDSWILKTAGY